MTPSPLIFFSVVVVAAALASPAATAFGDAPDVVALLQSSDRARGRVDVALEYTVDVDCIGQSAKALHRSYRLRSKGASAVVETVAPADQAGEKTVVNGRTIFQFKRTSKHPIAVTLANRMTGLAAVGDIVATGFADQYSGTITETVNLGPDRAYHLALKAKDSATTYPAVNYWISENLGVGLKAEMLSAAGTVFKTIEFKYEHTLELAGKRLPFASSAHFIHNNEPGSACDIRYGSPRQVEVNPDEFDVKKVAETHKSM